MICNLDREHLVSRVKVVRLGPPGTKIARVELLEPRDALPTGSRMWVSLEQLTPVDPITLLGELVE